jgi:hypothetical protein
LSGGLKTTVSGTDVQRRCRATVAALPNPESSSAKPDEAPRLNEQPEALLPVSTIQTKSWPSDFGVLLQEILNACKITV